MSTPLNAAQQKLALSHDAAQHGPRPLPLFLDLLMAETQNAPDRRAAALRGLKAYQLADRPSRRPAMPSVAREGRAFLRDYGGSGPPVIFVPSLINPPFILDLDEDNSLLRWLATQGLHPLLVDWGETIAEARELSIAGHVETLLLPLIKSIGERPHLVGYCLGGTMALGAAAAIKLRSLTLIASPWRFRGFEDKVRADIDALWTAAKPGADTLGMVPIEVLQSGFWRLDPTRVISKYEAFGRMEPGSQSARAFVALEDWANAGAPLTYAAGCELFEDFIGADVPGKGQWRIGGRSVDPMRLCAPATDFISLSDRIVPAASASGLPGARLGAGHVGMIVGSKARAQLWEPLVCWLSQPQQN